MCKTIFFFDEYNVLTIEVHIVTLKLEYTIIVKQLNYPFLSI